MDFDINIEFPFRIQKSKQPWKPTYICTFPEEEVKCRRLGEQIERLMEAQRGKRSRDRRRHPLVTLIDFFQRPEHLTVTLSFHFLVEQSMPINLPNVLMDNSLRKSFVLGTYDEF